MKRYIISTSALTDAENYLHKDFATDNPGPGPTYISIDGKFIQMYPTVDDHADLPEYVYDNYGIYLEGAVDEEYFVISSKWIRLRSDPYTAVLQLPESVTNPQWYSLEDWVDFILERGTRSLVIALISGEINKYTIEVDTSPRQIVSICKYVVMSKKFPHSV